MSKKFWFILMVILVMTSIVLAACEGSEEPAEEPAAEEPAAEEPAVDPDTEWVSTNKVHSVRADTVCKWRWGQLGWIFTETNINLVINQKNKVFYTTYIGDTKIYVGSATGPHMIPRSDAPCDD